MADASYDAVIIGGGHNGLITACYLALNGLSVAVFEREHELGGGACSEELPLPGFISDPCAHLVRIHSNPAYADFRLAEKGLDFVFPPTGYGAIFDDGSSIVTYPAWVAADKMTGSTAYSEQNVDKTINSIARISERDAETARIMFDNFRSKWLDAIIEVLLNPPRPWGQKNAIEKLMDDPESGFDPVWSVMTIGQMACDLWESPEMQCFFMVRIRSATDLFPEDVLGPENAADAIAMMLSVFAPWIPVGGTHAITHALQRALSELGGRFFVHHEVDQVLIEHGLAKGIRLVDGTEIAARRLVVSNLDADQTINRLIGPEHVSAKIARRARNVNCDRGQLYWTYFAFHELPQYNSFAYDPDSALLHGKALMAKDPDYLATKHRAEVLTRGFASRLTLFEWIDSIWDKSRAPLGKHIALVEEHAPPARYFSHREWQRLKREVAAEMVKQWQRYAPNMTGDNIIGVFVNSSYEIEKRNMCNRQGCSMMQSELAFQMGRFRPIPELSNHRTPIKNMYICAGYSLRGYGGYGCYKAIADDTGLRKLWAEKGRQH